MSHEVSADLPPSHLGENRHIQIGFEWHGDMGIWLWNGEERPDGVSFRLKDGYDAELLALFAGYYRRAQVGENETRHMIRNAGRELLKDRDLEYGSASRDVHHLRYISRGEHSPYLASYDQVDRGWTTLGDPMLTRATSMDGADTVTTFTRTHEHDELLMVIAHTVPSGNSREYEVASYEELCVADIPIVAETVCRASMGDYSRDIRRFVEKEFPV